MTSLSLMQRRVRTMRSLNSVAQQQRNYVDRRPLARDFFYRGRDGWIRWHLFMHFLIIR